MKRGGWLKRFKGLNPVNRKRKAERHVEAFGPPDFVPFVHAYGCVIAREKGPLSGCEGPVEAAHVHGRGRGWRNNIVGLCRGHHTAAPGSFHHCGSADAFDRRWETDLDLWACAVTGKYEEQA